MGMTEEVKTHVFEKFYQGDTSHHHAGYGIGLAMAQRATLLCGGRITVESEVGKGSRFTVTLPYIDSQRRFSVSGRSYTESKISRNLLLKFSFQNVCPSIYHESAPPTVTLFI